MHGMTFWTQEEEESDITKKSEFISQAINIVITICEYVISKLWIIVITHIKYNELGRQTYLVLSICATDIVMS